MKNKRILVFTLLMSALLVFSAMPAYSADDEATFEEPEFYVAESISLESGVNDDNYTEVATLDELKSKNASDLNGTLKFTAEVTDSNVGELLELVKSFIAGGLKEFSMTKTTVANLDFTSLEGIDKLAIKNLTTVKTVTLPASVTVFDATGAGLTALTLPPNAKMSVLTLNSLSDLETLNVTAAGTNLTKLFLDNARKLKELVLDSNTELTQLSLNNASSLKSLNLSALKKITVLIVTYLDAAGEGDITLPPSDGAVISLDIRGNQFPYLPRNYAALKTFFGSDQEVKRETISGSGKTFSLKKLFASYTFKSAAEGDVEVDPANFGSGVTGEGLDEDGEKLNLTGTVDSNGEVTWTQEPAAIKTITYSYAATDDASLEAVATLSGKPEETNGTVGGSGGGCSAGFGALALAAVAAFLLKKSR